MKVRTSNLILAYQRSDDAQRESNDRFWSGIADVFAFSVVWGAVGAVVITLVGATLLWGVLIANAAR